MWNGNQKKTRPAAVASKQIGHSISYDVGILFVHRPMKINGLRWGQGTRGRHYHAGCECAVCLFHQFSSAFECILFNGKCWLVKAEVWIGKEEQEEREVFMDQDAAWASWLLIFVITVWCHLIWCDIDIDIDGCRCPSHPAAHAPARWNFNIQLKQNSEFSRPENRDKQRRSKTYHSLCMGPLASICVNSASHLQDWSSWKGDWHPALASRW